MASLSRLHRSLLAPMFASALLALQTAAAAAQTNCEPVADRAGRSLGCFLTAREALGPLPPDTVLYWHIYSYPTLAGAKVAAAKSPRGLEGAQCLETPEGRLVQRAGEPGVMVRGGLPMRLTGIGTGVRRSLVLILQDSGQPRSTRALDWTPKGLCQP
jgi:hypothetical protein